MSNTLQQPIVASAFTPSKNTDSAKQKKKPSADVVIKQVIGASTNGLAAASNLAAFVNGNFSTSLGIEQDTLESYSEGLTKFATGLQGLVLGIDTIQKRQLIPAIGFLSEIPIALFTKEEDLWLARGFSQGLGQFQVLMDRRKLIVNGQEQKDKDGKDLYVSDMFNSLGWGDITKTYLKESFGIAKEIIQKPSTLKDISHNLLVTSVGQAIGGVAGVTGFKATGRALRDVFGIGVDFSFITDAKEKFSWFVMAGWTWIVAAVADYVKGIEVVNESIANLTNLSLVSDRGASLLYTIGNISIQGDKDDEASEEKVSLVQELTKQYTGRRELDSKYTASTAA